MINDFALRGDNRMASGNSGLPSILLVENETSLEVREDYSPPDDGTSNAPGVSAAEEESAAASEMIAEAEPKISINPRFMSFGRVRLKHGISRPIQVANYGSVDLINHYVSILGSGQQSFRPKTTCSVVSPGDIAKILIDFHPHTSGAKLGYLRICSNDPKEPVTQVHLRGEGQEIG